MPQGFCSNRDGFVLSGHDVSLHRRVQRSAGPEVGPGDDPATSGQRLLEAAREKHFAPHLQVARIRKRRQCLGTFYYVLITVRMSLANVGKIRMKIQ